MRVLSLSILIIIVIFPLNVYSFTKTENFFDISGRIYVSDEQLKQKAIEKGIIPENADEAYFNQEMERKNTVSLWILSDREEKIALIDALKQLFKQDVIIIINPCPYYVDEINAILYDCIVKGIFNAKAKKGLLFAFKTIAIMEGDFDDGSRDKIETFKKHLGEELLEKYKKERPRQYHEFLIDSQKR